MQFLNNDIDELMRRAADHYDPLVTGADWDGLAQKLDKAPLAVHPIASNSRRYGLLFLFLLSSLVCNKYLYLKFDKPGGLYAKAVLQPVMNEPVKATKERTKILDNQSEQSINRNAAITNISKPFYRSIALFKNDVVHDPIQENKYGNIDGRNTSTQTQVLISKPEFNRKSNARSIEPFKDLVLMQSNIVKLDQQNNTDQENKKEKRFYGGIVAGMDASTVKFEQLHTGWQGGVLLGYQLTNKWAVETGVLWSKKSYYAKGKDFNTDKMTLPSHAIIIHAEGYCNMFEIPIQVRYGFAKGNQSNLFATVGASSYIMQKEEYDYLYERYNVQYYSNKYYKTSSKHFMATINLSAGYQHKIGQGTLRLEPYIKLPVQKMGIGSLPITSVGLQAALTYPIR